MSILSIYLALVMGSFLQRQFQDDRSYIQFKIFYKNQALILYIYFMVTVPLANHRIWCVRDSHQLIARAIQRYYILPHKLNGF